jgi:DNA replication protein DnaC
VNSKLPPLPPTIYPLANEDAARADVLAGDRYSPANCLTCRGLKTFQWYEYGDGTKEVVTYDCPCDDQWILSRFLLASGILLKYQRYSVWDITSLEASQVYVEYVENYSAYIRNGIGMVLHGSSGTGKTLVAVLILKFLISRGLACHFTSFNELINTFASGWYDEDAKAWFYKRIKNASVLAIDDVGKEMKMGAKSSSSNISRSTIDEVLRHRVAMSLPTIITTNSTLDEISQRYQLSVLSLLEESAMSYDFHGADYRKAVPLILATEAKEGLARPVVL